MLPSRRAEQDKRLRSKEAEKTGERVWGTILLGWYRDREAAAGNCTQESCTWK